MKYKTVRVCHLQIKTFPGIYRENSPAGRICVKYSSPPLELSHQQRRNKISLKAFTDKIKRSILVSREVTSPCKPRLPPALSLSFYFKYNH